MLFDVSVHKNSGLRIEMQHLIKIITTCVVLKWTKIISNTSEEIACLLILSKANLRTCVINHENSNWIGFLTFMRYFRPTYKKKHQIRIIFMADFNLDMLMKTCIKFWHAFVLISWLAFVQQIKFRSHSFTLGPI